MTARRSSLDGPRRRTRRQKPADVVPFPANHRVAFVERQASTMASHKPESAERYLEHRLQAHRETLARKGIDPSIIDADCRALQSAINAALWRIILTGGAQ